MSSHAFGKFMRAGDMPRDAIVMAPYGEASEAKFHRAKRDKSYRFEYKTARSAREHNFVMAIIRDMFENQDEYESERAFRTRIKIEAGWIYEDPVIIDGVAHIQVKPTNWSDCGHDEFQEFKKSFIPVVYKRLGQAGLDRWRL